MSALAAVLRLGRSGRGRLVLAVVLGAGAAASAIGLTATSAWLISRASQQPPVLHLMVAIVAVRTFGIARGVLRYGERLAGHDAAFRTLGDLRVATVERLARLVPARGRSLVSGDLLARFVGDVDGLMDLWVRVLVPAAVAALVGGATVVLVAVLLPSAALVLGVSLLAAAAIAPAVSIAIARRAARRVAPVRGAYQAELVDLLDGAAELTVLGAIDDRLERLEALDRELARAERRGSWGAGIGASLATVAGGAAVWAALALGADAVAGGTLDGVVLAVVVLTPLAVHELFAALTPGALALPQLAGAASRLRQVLDQPDPVREPPQPEPVPAGPYGLRLRGVSARWDPDGPEVLTGVDLDLPAGERLVVTGPSGTGKSTLVAVLLRFLDPTAGAVELVGADRTVDLRRLDGDAVRALIGWLGQDAYVFDSTVAANLRVARPEASNDELLAALDRARLGDWVRSLPDGLETFVGEHGRQLSGGQRQRLALARVLLADRPILVLDEPTEHLDEPTARALMADLLAVAADRTTLLVTHRPELVPGDATVVSVGATRLDPGSPPARLRAPILQ